jgi:WD40 repeat protein
VSSPDILHFTIKPKALPVAFLHLQPTSIFIGYHSSCLLIERDTLNIVVQHSSYHKKALRMGLVLNSILLTGDEDELILFWNKDKVRRYQIPVNRGDIVGKKLIIAGFDNRVRIYDVNSETGIQKLHVFVGHVMNIYNLTVIDDGIFTSYSYDGTIRWWNTQVKACFSFFNVDVPLFSSKNILGMIKFYAWTCPSSA